MKQLKNLSPEERIHQKLKDVFDKTLDSEIQYEGSLKDIDFYALQCKAAAADSFYTIMESNVSMFNYNYEGSEAILIVFSIPINSDSGTKHVAERVMQIIETTEKCFINLDYSTSREVREDKFIHVTIIKKIEEKV